MRHLTTAKLEQLSTALNAALLAEADVNADFASALRAIRTSNELADACVHCGMSPSEPDHTSWAAERVAQWLMAA